MHLVRFPSIIVATALSVGALSLAGCSVARHQQTVGSYLDDTTITTKVKTAFAEDKTVAATSIGVETLNGEVMLSGFAKSTMEKAQAGELAKSVNGVRSVRNSIVVR